MSTKFFTLSAVCVLVLCMLLSLSGTTDFPESGTSASDVVAPGPASQEQPSGGAPAPKYRIQEWPEGQNPGSSGMEAIQEISHSRQLRLLGLLFIVGWIVLSFKLLSLD
ncbi:MAG: hypothetical protein AB1640_19520 [bacterium]